MKAIVIYLVLAALATNWVIDNFSLESVAAAQCGKHYTTDQDIHDCMVAAGYQGE